MSASPTRLQSANGTSTITVVARRANGTPVNPGTEVRFDTDLGTVTPVAETNSSGVATATFRGDGRIGTAKVRATVGGVAEAVTLDLEVGAPAKTITLQPSPTTVTADGGRINLLAIVRDSRGQALSGQGVNFTTDVGRLTSGGAIVETNNNGQARDTLILSAADVLNESSVSVTAQTAGSDGSLISTSFSIRVQGGRPVASFDYEQGGSDREVDFTSTSEGGQGRLTYTWDFGDNTGSSEAVTSHTYATAGPYTVKLTVTDDLGQSDQATARITVPVTTPGSGN
ncbi:MAG TPA: PKD domain-containing protein [Thermoanaerobaculia bacterium]|nr:PKD domain-containing protein [Thermoanaerobaculia bacterium]